MRLQNVTVREMAVIAISIPPGLNIFELRQIGAEDAGADAAREVLAQLRIIASGCARYWRGCFWLPAPAPARRARSFDARGHAARQPRQVGG